MEGFKAALLSSEKQFSKEGNYPRLELPREMLEMIFAHSGNLLQLTLVCPTFNDIISKSPLVMRRLKVKWIAASTQTSCLLESDRKYERLHLFWVHPCWQQVKYFVEKHKRTLIDLEIDRNVRLEPRQYFECLSILCGNLKTLKATNLPEEIASMGVLELPKLEELTWSSNNRPMLQAFKTPKLKKFSQTGARELWNLEKITENSTMNFLRNQPQLQDLEISDDSYVREFFEAASSFRSLNIFPFLESQRQSLKVLSLQPALQEADLRKILTLELEELELSTNEYPSIGPSIVQNKTIKKLTLTIIPSNRLHSERSVSLIESCPNVETLSLQHFQISKALSSAIASKLTKLKNLSLRLSSFDFPPSEMDRYPSVETFSVEYVSRQMTKSFVAANPHVRVIDISLSKTNELRLGLLRLFPLSLN